MGLGRGGAPEIDRTPVGLRSDLIQERLSVLLTFRLIFSVVLLGGLPGSSRHPDPPPGLGGCRPLQLPRGGGGESKTVKNTF